MTDFNKSIARILRTNCRYLADYTVRTSNDKKTRRIKVNTSMREVLIPPTFSPNDVMLALPDTMQKAETMLHFEALQMGIRLDSDEGHLRACIREFRKTRPHYLRTVLKEELEQ